MTYIGLLVGIFFFLFAVWFWGAIAFLLAVAVRGIWQQMGGTTPSREDALRAPRGPGIGGGTPEPPSPARGALPSR